MQNYSSYYYPNNLYYKEIFTNTTPLSPLPDSNKSNTHGSNYGKYVSLSLMALIGLLLLIVPIIKHRELTSHIKEKYNSMKEEYDESEKKKFKDSLFKMKGGLLLLLLLISFYYQIEFSGNTQYNTYFGDSNYSWRPFVVGLVTAILGMTSVMYIMKSRGTNILKHLIPVLIVGSILFVFEISKEASGFNRYMAKNQIIQGHGNYYTIDKSNNASTNTILQTGEQIIGDPFIKSFSYVCVFFIMLIMIYYVGIMLLSSYYGYKSGEFNISNIEFFNEGYESSMFFVLELVMMVFLNIIPVLIAPSIRGESFTKSDALIAGCMGFASLGLHFMFQYNGFYKFE
jgi:hypothetical protein